MAKKEFKSGLDSIFQNTSVAVQVEENEPEQNVSEHRATFIIEDEQLLKIRALSYWHRKQLKQLLKEVFSSYLNTISKEELQNALYAYKNSGKS